jgi:hypothetical protein
MRVGFPGRAQHCGILPVSGPQPTHHDGEDQSYDVDGVRGTKTRDDGEPQVVLRHRHVLLGLVIFSVGLGTAALQRSLEVRAWSVLRHGQSRLHWEGEGAHGSRVLGLWLPAHGEVLKS